VKSYFQFGPISTTTNSAEKSIVVRADQRRRYTDTDGQTVRRIIRFNGPILSSDLGGMKEGDHVTLWIEETAQTQVATGSITTDQEHREQLVPEIQLTLPHAAFTDFWNASSSTDSALRNVTLKIEDAMMELVITDVAGGNAHSSGRSGDALYVATAAALPDWSDCRRWGACSVRNCEGDLGALARTVTLRARCRLLAFFRRSRPKGSETSAHNAAIVHSFAMWM
jgi:hypothetical protein